MEMSALLDRYLGPRWAEEPAGNGTWSRVDRIPDEELWRVHQIRRERLVHYARRRLALQVRHHPVAAGQHFTWNLRVAAFLGEPHQHAAAFGLLRRVGTR